MNVSIKCTVSKVLLLMVFFVLTISCTNSETTVLTESQPQGLFIKFNSTGNQYVINNPLTINLTNKKIDALQGTNANLVNITLYMPLEPTIGTHFMTDTPSDDDSYGGYLVVGNSIDMLSNNGLITITRITDDEISGTFNFSGLNGTSTVEVSNGSFSADR